MKRGTKFIVALAAAAFTFGTLTLTPGSRNYCRHHHYHQGWHHHHDGHDCR